MVPLRSLLRAALVVALVVTAAPAAFAEQPGKLDAALAARAGKGGSSRVIVTLKPGADISGDIVRYGGRTGRRLSLINGQVATVPNAALKQLAENPGVARIDADRPVERQMALVANTIGARSVWYSYGYTGAGVGVAVIDSGITSWHDDLVDVRNVTANYVRGNQRVAAFMDFVNGATQPYDDNGHGTHVSGIILGNGYDSKYVRAGVAPEAHLVSLKVLDANGRGLISNVIAALEYAVANRVAYNIRVVNLSVGAPVTTSYWNDPLTLAAKRAVDAGIVVVAAAGNLGRSANGTVQYGGITAPGNAPWVLTVGAANHQGTLKRTDDAVATFSSRGPTAIDFAAKPDVVAPGTGIISMAARDSALYTAKAGSLLKGTISTSYPPYMNLSGTSMAAPVVTGSVALMLQANPNLTPNLVKAILQYTAQLQTGADLLSQGGGFVNTKGAVDLARYFRYARKNESYPTDRNWSRQVTWGNRRLGGGVISPFGTAWETTTTWGAAVDVDGDNVVWGTECVDLCRNVVWGTATRTGDLSLWGSVEGDNVVWGTADAEGDNVVWGTYADGDNVVWGTLADGDNVVWGTLCGGDDCFNVVWGTATGEGDNVVWGTCEESDCFNVVWGTHGMTPDSVWAATVIENPLWDLSSEGVMVQTTEEWNTLWETTTTTTTTTTKSRGKK